MIIENEKSLTTAVLEVMQRTSGPRLREIMLSLIRHLHGFIREVRQSEAEFREATAILNEIGQRSTDTHNEMVLITGYQSDRTRATSAPAAVGHELRSRSPAIAVGSTSNS